MIGRIRFYGLGAQGVLVLMLLWVAVARAAPVLPPAERIVAQFEEVAFGHEHGPSRDALQKWQRPPQLAVFVQPRFDLSPYVQPIERHLEEIASLTGLQVSPSDDFRRATLRLGFVAARDFLKLAPPAADQEVVRFLASSACLAVAVTDPAQPGHISRGSIFIGTDISDRLRSHCLLEELVQVLGLPNDACHYRPSLFCEDDYVTEMTPADKILLRALYDGRLRAGQHRSEALPTVRLIVAELIGLGNMTLAPALVGGRESLPQP